MGQNSFVKWCYALKEIKTFILTPIISIPFSAQFWNLTVDATLINKFTSFWEFEENKWLLSDDYIIDNSTGKVLTIGDDNRIILKEKLDNLSDKQKWIKSTSDSKGWFTLQNPSSKKFLTNEITEDDNSLTFAKGDFFLTFHIFCDLYYVRIL